MIEKIEKMAYDEARKIARCPYRQDLKILCLENCGRGNAADCPIWRVESGRLAYELTQVDR